MKIYILTGKFGMGHWSAARSLRQQLERDFPGAQIHIVDLMEYSIPNFSETMYKAFQLLVTYGSGLFNIYYKWTDHSKGLDHSVEYPMPFEGLLVERLAELLDREQPDAVISTHPLCARIAAGYKREYNSDLPLITCVTDLSSHSEWIYAGTDCYLVGSPELRDRLAAKGVDPAHIHATGIPVRMEFQSPVRRRGGKERQLLIMGGGLGLLPRRDTFYERLNALPHLHTTLITGSNRKLYDRLQGRYDHIQIVGYTDRVYEYMAQADLMLSKPGGITVFEAIFSELPILAWEPFLQQEKENTRFLLDNGIGRLAHTGSTACLSAIQDLIYDRAALEQMSSRMHGLKGQLEVESLRLMMQTFARSGEGAPCPAAKVR